MIPNSQGLETLNKFVSLICRTLDVINRLFSRVLAQTQSLGTYIHFAISILGPFSPLRPSISIYLYSVYLHTHAYKCTYVCVCVNTHTCTPRQMGDLFERSPWSQLRSSITRDRPIRGVSIRRTPIRGFHPCYYLAARPHLASSAHLYEHTHTHTQYMLAYMRVGRF